MIRTALGFAIVLAVFIIGPPFLPATFGPYPLLRWGDVLDLATPFVVLPVAWLLYVGSCGQPLRLREGLAFVALGGLFAMGQGMHLAANAIGHLVPEGSGDLQVLTHDLDEVVSHFIWHGALIGLSALIVVRSLGNTDWTDAATSPRSLASMTLAMVIFGFTFFAMVVEGGTALIGLPGAALIAAVGRSLAGRSMFRRPAVALFSGGYLVALLLCLIWAAMNGWQLVEFSKAGLIQ